MRRLLVMLLTVMLGAGTARAQDVRALVQQGAARQEAMDPAGALVLFRRALAVDSLDYEANWRAAVALIDAGKLTPDEVKSATRDAAYVEAERLARRAVQARPAEANGHFVLAFAIGRAAMTREPRERVKNAVEVRNAAVRALQLDARHDGAWHVLGRWHAEMLRVSSMQRFFARQFLGAKVFDEASWDKAVQYLERAVALDPQRIYHRLDLALVYADRERVEDAEAQCAAIAQLPVRDVADTMYQREAALLRARLASGRGLSGDVVSGR